MPSRRALRPRNSQPEHYRLNYDPLEIRALMAGFNWNTILNNRLISSLVSQLASQFSSPPSYVQTPSIVGSSVVTTKTAQLSALGSDDAGEKSLKYFWQVQSAPANGSVQFSSNGSNNAKNTTVTFGAAGSYQILSRIVDGFGLSTSSVITIQVNQTASSVAVKSAGARSVAPGSFVVTTASSLSYTAQVLDQFGLPMNVQPNINWSIANTPVGSSPNLATTGNSATFGFEQAGDYLLRVNSGICTHQFTARITPLLSRLAFMQSNGTAISSGQTLPVNARDYSLRLQGFDQFHDTLAKLGAQAWSVISKPANSTASIASGNSTVNFSFNRSGTYNVRCQTPNGPFDLSLEVNQVFNSLRVVSGTTTLSEKSLNRFTLDTANLNATALDQFGQSLVSQPQLIWSLPAQPLNSDTSLSSSGASAEIQFDRVGSYVVRVGGGSISAQYPVEIVPKLTSLVVSTLSGQTVSSGTLTSVTTDNQRFIIRGLDQFGQQLTKLPTMTWATGTAPVGGGATVSFLADVASFKFTRAGMYVLKVSSGAELFRFSFAVQSVLNRLEILSSSGTSIKNGSQISSAGTPGSFNVRGLDQFGQAVSPQPEVTWSVPTMPEGAEPNLIQSGNQFAISFERAGCYALKVSVDSLETGIVVNIAQRLSSIQITPGTVSIDTGSIRQFSATLLDQFNRSMSNQGTTSWSATGGTISSTGLYTAGAIPGTYSVTAKTGTLTKSASVSLSSPAIVDGFSNADIRSLVSGYYSDSSISRLEMVDILRSAGDDGVVTASELADLRFFIAKSSNYQMVDYVRALAGDVVSGNRANSTYQGQALGDLAAGSTDVRLNRLVDKWFLGTDLPILTSGSLQYRAATGNLFVGTPGLYDAKQGMLGDCYFIASLVSIAGRNPTAVQNMFIDNGDDTFTVRFFGGSYGSYYDSSGQISTGFATGKGTADYVTVNRQLPTYSTGSYAYSNYGLSSSSSNVPLWVALAEKAYAQWNQTGNAGRDGTLNFSSIEGGWMGDVNAQVLGYNSIENYFTASSSSAMVNALSNGRAVTLGTNSSTGIADLVGGHAYTVSGYNASTGRFTLHNPWGYSHPAPLTWSQLVSSCTAFVVVNPTSSGVAAKPIWNFSVGLRAGETLRIAFTQLANLNSEGSTADMSSEEKLEEQVRLDPAGEFDTVSVEGKDNSPMDSMKGDFEEEPARNQKDRLIGPVNESSPFDLVFADVVSLTKLFTQLSV